MTFFTRVGFPKDYEPRPRQTPALLSHVFKNRAATVNAWVTRHLNGEGRDGDKYRNGKFKVVNSGEVDLEAYAKRRNGHAGVTEEQVLSKFPKADRSYIEKMLKKVAMSLPTDREFTDGEGHYTDKRVLEHERILGKLFSPENIARCTPAKGESKTLIVLGGRGGSGKSNLTNGNLQVPDTFDPKKFLHLDSDWIKEQLPGYEGWNAALYHEEASHVLEQAKAKAFSLGMNIIDDATLRSTTHIGEDMAFAMEHNYVVNGAYMFLDRKEAAGRAVTRALGKGEKKRERGRLVPPHVVLDNVNNEKNFNGFKKYFSKWWAFDNSVPEGVPPFQIGGGTNGENRRKVYP